MDKITARTPWEPWMGSVPMHLDYFQGTMFEAVEKIARQYPENIAFDFMGKSTDPGDRALRQGPEGAGYQGRGQGHHRHA